MQETSNLIGPGQIIILCLIGILSVSFALTFFLISRGKKLKSADGTVFRSEEELKKYEELVTKLEPLFDQTKKDSQYKDTLGLDSSFIKLLTQQGFINLKTLLKYRYQFIKLASLISE